MALCKYCDALIYWENRIPFDWDGTDHRERCAGMGPRYRHQLRDANHEKRVAQFLSLKAVRHSAAKPAKRPLISRGGRTAFRGTHLYRGDVPPWDESLGPYRDFTEQEKCDGAVCAPVR
jgi:hypothetical protein